MNKCIAAVDMGTNSFHLIIVQVKEDGSFKIIDREREVIRLGSHKGKEFTWISEGEMEKAIDVLKDFAKIAQFYKADVRAIATSAIREAKNKSEFIDRVFEETEIKVKLSMVKPRLSSFISVYKMHWMFIIKKFFVLILAAAARSF